MAYRGFYRPYISKAEQKVTALKKKNLDIKPVLIEGRTLARTWWGKAENSNLENYAGYHNRISRGRSYVRNGAVLDLQINAGLIKSLVQGSNSSPYRVEIGIKPLDEKIWNNIKNICKGEFDSLQELLEGKFPKALTEVFTDKKSGLFPSPSKISFSRSCPDWASMCKHVAATLYGVGARLDNEPALFFRPRKVEMNDLITMVVGDKTASLLKKVEQKSSRVIDDSDLSSLFGIDMEGIEPILKNDAKISRAKKEKSPILKTASRHEAGSLWARAAAGIQAATAY